MTEDLRNKFDVVGELIRQGTGLALALMVVAGGFWLFDKHVGKWMEHQSRLFDSIALTEVSNSEMNEQFLLDVAKHLELRQEVVDNQAELAKQLVDVMHLNTQILDRLTLPLPHHDDGKAGSGALIPTEER